MPKASQMQVDRNVSLLLKGPNGFGKTIAACSFAAAGQVFLAYFDKRQPIELLTFFKEFRPDLLDNIEYEVYSASNPNEYLNKLIRLQSDCRYVAVITDSVTNLTTSTVNWSQIYRITKDGKTKRDVDPDKLVPDFDDYKVETALASQALDITKSLPCFNIWIAHPIPRLEISGSGRSIKVTKVTDIVSYGRKVGAMVPGSFTEIYHFARGTDYSTGTIKSKYLVCTDAVGDDYAKTSLGLPTELDITNKLFYEVWQPLAAEAIAKLEKKVEVKDDVDEHIIEKPTTEWKPKW